MMLCYAKNPHLIINARGEREEIYKHDIGAPELAALIDILETELEKELDGGVFADYIGGTAWD